MRVADCFIRSKKGEDLSTCEDGWVVTDHYACVVDGATSATGSRWTSQQITGGQWAARTLIDAIPRLKPDYSSREIVDQLTDCIHIAYKAEGVLAQMIAKPEERATASMILYSKKLRQLTVVGDCQAALLNKSGSITKIIQPVKHNDDVMSQARCMFLQLQLARGKTVEQLREEPDMGRQFIEPLRVGQRLFQNNPDAPDLYQYWAMDGFHIADTGIEIHDVPNEVQEVILATDGYPTLFPTLMQTEQYLKTLIQKDPLMMDSCLGTKGVRPGAESFDDRTFVRVVLDADADADAGTA